MFTANAAEDLEDLGCELAGGGNDEGAEAVEGGPFLAVEELKYRDEEGEGLPGAGFGGAEDIAALQGYWEGSALDVGEGLEVGLVQAAGGLAGEGELCEFGGLEVLFLERERGWILAMGVAGGGGSDIRWDRLTNSETLFSSAARSASSRFRLRPLDGLLDGGLGGRTPLEAGLGWGRAVGIAMVGGRDWENLFCADVGGQVTRLATVTRPAPSPPLPHPPPLL